MRQLVNHLAGLGHRRIAMIAGKPHVATTVERMEAYRRALETHGIGVDEKLIQAPDVLTIRAASKFEPECEHI